MSTRAMAIGCNNLCSIIPTSVSLSNELLAHLFAWIIDCNNFVPSNRTGHMDWSGQSKQSQLKGKRPSGNIVYTLKWCSQARASVSCLSKILQRNK